MKIGRPIKEWSQYTRKKVRIVFWLIQKFCTIFADFEISKKNLQEDRNLLLNGELGNFRDNHKYVSFKNDPVNCRIQGEGASYLQVLLVINILFRSEV